MAGSRLENPQVMDSVEGMERVGVDDTEHGLASESGKSSTSIL